MSQELQAAGGFSTSAKLLFMGWIINIFADITGEAVYLWTFRAISLLSITLVVIINWRKAVAELKAILKK